MRRNVTPKLRKPRMIACGGQARNAGSTHGPTGSPKSRTIAATGISFVKLQRPFAVMRILAPTRALRSNTKQPIPRSAATAAANSPAAPPPITARSTGACRNAAAFSLTFSLTRSVYRKNRPPGHTKLAAKMTVQQGQTFLRRQSANRHRSIIAGPKLFEAVAKKEYDVTPSNLKKKRTELMGLITILAGLAGLFAICLAATVFLLLKTKHEKSAPWEDHDRLIGELAQQKQLFTLAEENLQRRLADKEAECARLIASCQEACARRLEEKDRACERVLAEREAALTRQNADCQRQLNDKDEQCRRTIAEKNLEIERFLQEKERAFSKTVETLREQFANLAAQTLKGQTADLSDLNKSQIEAVLKPLREQIHLLQEATQKAETEHAHLKDSFTENVGTIESIAKDLMKTASALSSDTRVQGRKGEDILAEKLRQAGLEENVNFFLQSGTDTDRPDAQICDTENRWLVIDSKVSLTAFLDYAAAQDETVKKAKLAAHLASVRQKIDQLAKKKYPLSLTKEYPERNYLPVTAMFVPYEAPLLEALRADPSLWQFAMQNNVVLITPLTLIAYLRLVYLAWQHEKEDRNRQEIVQTARGLLARMNNFLLAFEKLEASIESLRTAYAGAKNLLVDAPNTHTIAKAANRLLELHVRLENKKGARVTKAKSLLAAEDDPSGNETETC